MEKQKQKTISGFIFLICMICIVGILFFFGMKYFIPLCRLLGTQQGRDKLAVFIGKAGIFAPLVFILLMALQVIIAFLPGGPLEITAGMLFGGWMGTVFTVAGMFLGTLVVYGLVKKFGRRLVHLFISEEKMKHYSVLEEKDRLAFWVFVLFLIPGIPKDLLTYIVPLTDMPGRQFLLLSLVARFPALVSSVLLGSSLTEGRYWLCIVIACIATVLAFVGFYIKHNMHHLQKWHLKSKLKKKGHK